MGKPMSFRAAASKERAVRDRSGPKQLARTKTIFNTSNGRSDAERQAWGRRMVEARTQAAARRKVELAEQIGGRDTSAEVIEHIVVPPPYVSPERARQLQERCWVGPTQRNTVTGKVSHMVRRRVGDRFVTERIDGPAPTQPEAAKAPPWGR